MQMRHPFRSSLCVFFAFLLLASCFAIAQESEEKERFGRKDDPAAREQWFRRGRQTRNGQPAAKMLHQAYQAKMKLRAARESKFRALATSHSKVDSPLAASVGTWTNLGPRPIFDSQTVPNGYGPTSGRVTAVVVDQSDSTGNTVYAAGAYGGLWKSTNAASTDPTLVQWTPLIDDQATLAVGAIALQPGHSNTILVGTGEPNYAGDSYFGVGILRSNDGGATWTTIAQSTDGSSLYGAGISQFAFSTANTNTVVAAASWATNGPYLNATPSNGLPGLFISTNAGATWTVAPLTDDGSNYFTGNVSSIVYNPKQDKFYAVVPYEGVYVSQGTSAAGFTSFRRMTNQPGKSGVLSVSACPASGSPSCPLLRGAMTVRPVLSGSDPDQMYVWFVADGSGDSSDDQGIWKSTTDNSGNVTWSSISDTGITNCGDSYGCGTTQSFYNLYLNAVPNGANTDLYAGTINIYKCSISSANPTCATTAFQNLTHAYGCSAVAGVHPDQHAFDFLQSNPAIAYFGNDGGIYRSLAAQTSLHNGSCTGTNAFDNLNNHIGSLTQFMWGTNHPTDPGTIMGGTQDNGTMAISPSSPAGGDAGWWEVNGGDGGYDWIDPVTPTNWYSAYTYVSVQYCTSTINCNTDTFDPLIIESNSANIHQTDGDLSNFYTPYILDPAKPTQIILGTCRVWRGPNVSTSWPNNSTANAISHKLGQTSNAACGGTDDMIQSIAAGGPSGPNGSKVMYVGTSGGHVYTTSNADTGIATWTEITGSINPNGFPISGAAIDWNDPTGMTAWVTIQGFTSSGLGHVWVTYDGGASWRQAGTNLPNVPVNDIAEDPTSPTLYVATDSGVWTASTDYSAVWNEVGPTSGTGYLPNVAVLHLAVFHNLGDHRLRAWTHGRGVWETGLSTPDLTITPDPVNFQLAVGSTATASVMITNNTSGAITLGTPSLNTDLPVEYTLLPSLTTCTSSLASAATCAVGIQFAPTAIGENGATLSITSSSPNIPLIQVLLEGNATQAATDFSLDTTNLIPSATATAGTAASFGSFVVKASPTGGTFSSAVTFTCSGLPSKSACAFSPSSSVSQSGSSVALMITTTAATTAINSTPLRPFLASGTVAFALCLPGLLLMCSVSRRKKWWMMSATFLLALACLGTISCGGGGSKPQPPPTTIPGTPTGTYTITITGTYGSTTHTQTVTLTVQ